MSGDSGQHCLLAERDIGASLFTSANSSVRQACFHANHLLTVHYKMAKWKRKYVEKKTTITYNNDIKQTDIDSHSPNRNIFEHLPASRLPSLFITDFL